MDNAQRTNQTPNGLGTGDEAVSINAKSAVQEVRQHHPQTLVLFHGGGCTDGWAAAYAAWENFGDDAEYVPQQYGTDTLPDIKGRDVYILDFSYPRDVMERIFAEAKSVVWLDHHKTAFEMWCKDGEDYYYEDNYTPDRYILLDNESSGALLAWTHFFPEDPVPKVIEHIDDRDRWQFKMRGSKEIHLALQASKPWTFEQWAELTHPDSYGSLFSAGATLLKAQNTQVATSTKAAAPVTIPLPSPMFPDAAVKGLAVNTPVYMSEVGHELAVKSGTYGLIWYYDGATGRANVSLRSNGDYDVSEIAKKFGGGGHLNAAGFNIDVPTLLGWLKG